MDWSKLDPNTAWQAILVVGGILGWLWHKARGEKTQSLRELLADVVNHVLLELAANPAPLEVARARLEDELYKAAASINISRRWAKPAVDYAIAQALAELRRRMNAAALPELPAKLEALNDAAQRVSEAFTPPKVPTVPRLGLNFELMTDEEAAAAKDG